MELYNTDCLDKMKDIKSNTIDLLFCDLPYGQTSCKWDSLIDLGVFWKEVNRICKDTTPMFFTCSTKFGVSLINSNPKNFRYDLVWVKSAPCGFLNAKRMPMKKHEMIYVFYRKLPFYDLSSHTHKFLKKDTNTLKKGFVDGKNTYGKFTYYNGDNGYDPPLPVSVVKEEHSQTSKEMKAGINNLYGDMKGGTIGNIHGTNYDPPLPNSVIKTDEIYGNSYLDKKEDFKNRNGAPRYDPPLPNSVIKTESITAYGNNIHYHNKEQKNGESIYDPPLPHSLLEIKSERGKHATQKPVDLIEWCLKYYSKEGDTVLDPTMGSGSTGVACKNMNRNFIGIERDTDIYNSALKRLSD